MLELRSIHKEQSRRRYVKYRPSRTCALSNGAIGYKLARAVNAHLIRVKQLRQGKLLPGYGRVIPFI